MNNVFVNYLVLITVKCDFLVHFNLDIYSI